MSNAQALSDIQARFSGHPFLDYFDCLTEALKAARSRNKLAVRARLAGDRGAVAQHLHMRRYYMQRVRLWHGMIDWSAK